MSSDDIKILINEANTALRKAEREMFSGKYDVVITGIEKVRSIIEEAKSLDPDNVQLNSLQKKAEKLIKDVERRTGKDLGGGSGTVRTSTDATLPDIPAPKEQKEMRKAAPSPAPAGSKTDKLPYNARRPMQMAVSGLSGIELSVKKLDGLDLDKQKSIIGRIENRLSEAKRSLEEARKEAAKQGVDSHPDFDDAEIKLKEYEKKFQEVKGGFDEASESAESGAKEVVEDCETLHEEYNRLRSVFDKAGNTYFNDLEPLFEIIDIIEKFENDELDGVQEMLSGFESKYGSDPSDIRQKADSLGYTHHMYNASYGYEGLKEGVAKIENSRTVLAEMLVDQITRQISGFSALHDFFRLENHKTAGEYLIMALRFSPDNPKVKEMESSINTAVETDRKEFIEKIDSKDWPGNSSGKEAKEAMKYFEESEDWGKRPAGKETRTPLGLVIHGDWSVQEKDIHGNPIMYGIPAFIAVQVDTEEGDKLARVYDVTMRTLESPDAKPKPPFHSITVGNSWYIRSEKIK